MTFFYNNCNWLVHHITKFDRLLSNFHFIEIFCVIDSYGYVQCPIYGRTAAAVAHSLHVATNKLKNLEYTFQKFPPLNQCCTAAVVHKRDPIEGLQSHVTWH